MIKKIYIYMIIVMISNLTGCTNRTNKSQSGSIRFILPEFKSGDAKLTQDFIITSKGTIQLINQKTQEIKDLGIEGSWLSCIEKEETIIIVYNNWNQQTGICIVDNLGNIISNNVILQTDFLCIDPTIIEVDDTYYITITEIQGNVNNQDNKQDNGIYTVKLLKSKDLITWTYVSDIISYENNIEDVEMNYKDGILYFTFEKETIDKGLSSICMITSLDLGKTWSEEKELLAATADQEPARFIEEDNKWYLYYSSDKEALGESYSGADVYYAVFDDKFTQISKDHLIDIDNFKGTLLYDVEVQETKLKLLYSRDYLNENSLIIEEVNR